MMPSTTSTTSNAKCTLRLQFIASFQWARNSATTFLQLQILRFIFKLWAIKTVSDCYAVNAAKDFTPFCHFKCCNLEQKRLLTFMKHSPTFPCRAIAASYLQTT